MASRRSGGEISLLSEVFGLAILELGDVLFVLTHDSDYSSDGQIFGAIREENGGHVARLLHFKVDGGLVTLDTAQDVSRSEFIPHLELPLADVSLGRLSMISLP